MKVYLVEDCHNAPGRILAVFRHLEDAELHVEALPFSALVYERTLIEGQAPNPSGYVE